MNFLPKLILFIMGYMLVLCLWSMILDWFEARSEKKGASSE